MKFTRYLGVVLAGAVLALTTALSGGGAVAAKQPMAVCDQPVSARAGGWVCDVTTVAESQRQSEANRKRVEGKSFKPMTKVGTNGAAATTTATTSSIGGYCSAAGCWSEGVDNAHAVYSGQGLYGYGKTYLGTMHLYYKIALSGRKATSNPYTVFDSRGFRNLRMLGDRRYLSNTYPGGMTLDSGAHKQYYTKYSITNSMQNVYFIYDATNGYVSYGSGEAWAIHYHAFSWKDPSSAYPGTWSQWSKSPKMQKQSSGAYYFYVSGGHLTMPAAPDGGGYNTY